MAGVEKCPGSSVTTAPSGFTHLVFPGRRAWSSTFVIDVGMYRFLLFHYL